MGQSESIILGMDFKSMGIIITQQNKHRDLIRYTIEFAERRTCKFSLLKCLLGNWASVILLQRCTFNLIEGEALSIALRWLGRQTNNLEKQIAIMTETQALLGALEALERTSQIINGKWCKMWPSGMERLRKLIHKLSQRLGITDLNVTLHSLRYGGGKWDKIEGLIADKEIKRRDRWVQDKPSGTTSR